MRDRLQTVAGVVNRAWREHPLVLSLLVVAAMCLTSMLFFDRPVARYYHDAAPREMVAVFKVITTFGDATPYLIILAVLIPATHFGAALGLYQARAARLRRYRDACLFVLLSIAVSGVILHLIKFGIGRFRPRALFESGLYGASPFTLGYLNNAFPSGHAQLIWAVATALVFVLPRYQLAYLAVAMLVSYSRVVTTDHYLSDVLFGSYLGAATTIVLRHYFYDRRGIPVRLWFARDAAPCPENERGGGQEER